MKSGRVFYICPVCFRICKTRETCHGRQMIACDPGEPGDERRKPVTDRFGQFVSRAPRWYLEAMGHFPDEYPGGPVSADAA